MAANTTIPRDRGAYSFWTPVSIRYSDQDPMEHVNNVAITAFLESGRIGFANHIFQDVDLHPKGVVLASVTVDFLREISFPGTVEVGGILAAVGERSITTQYGIFQGDTCYVVSQSVMVFFNPQTRRSAAPPPELKAALERFLIGG
ncbi:MAG: acyl-CoA thioesterase [Hyphomicrobiales bacterium]|nr:acyl-CoA thioesterase [Hyphomicrobiales bacterium]MCP5000510.1 acyl-CoA thioesterase [Hyphomicrobiales bacterium]